MRRTRSRRGVARGRFAMRCQAYGRFSQLKVSDDGLLLCVMEGVEGDFFGWNCIVWLGTNCLDLLSYRYAFSRPWVQCVYSFLIIHGIQV